MQFRIKTAFVFLAVLGATLGVGRAVWVAYVLPSLKEKRVAKEIENLGGYVIWEGMHVTEVHAPHNDSWGNRDLANVVPHIRKFENLRTLDLRFSVRLTDAGLEALRKINNVESVVLGQTGVTDGGLIHLRHLGLTRLAMQGCDLRGGGTQDLVKLQNLKFLDLEGARINRASMSDVAHLSSLIFLKINGTKVSDTDVGELVPLERLESLFLQSTQITDECVIHLQQFRNLRMVDVRDTRMTANGVNQLKQALPNLVIRHRSK